MASIVSVKSLSLPDSRSSNKQYKTVFEPYQLLCILFLRKICGACGGNKCHWCIVAIVKIERLELNRYRGIPQKRSVESSCIGWLSCMLGVYPRRDTAILRQGARGERCSTFSPCLPCM